MSQVLSSLKAHPVRAATTAGLCAFFLWLTLAKSLPYALVPISPDLALTLNPNNPEALLAKAELLRARLLAVARETEGAGRPHAADTSKPDARPWPSADYERFRTEIRNLAERTIAVDPLNSHAFRLLAEVSTERSEARALMQQAVARSRRETIAVVWLLQDSYERKDSGALIDYAEILLRSQNDLNDRIFPYLAAVASDEKGLRSLVKRLTTAPSWRQPFLSALPRLMPTIEMPFHVLSALKEAGSPIANQELAPYLNDLISKGLVDFAYDAWLQLLPKEAGNSLGLLTNADFSTDPSGLPFDWRIAPGQNALAELVSIGPHEGGRVLHIQFGGGRVQFPELTQVVLLAPGHYRLEGKVRGRIAAKRGLRWQLRCATGEHRLIAESELLMVQSELWRAFAMDAQVPPESADCVGQTLRLFHDARSASEEFISGEAWFGGLHMEWISAGASPSATLQSSSAAR